MALLVFEISVSAEITEEMQAEARFNGRTLTS